MLTAGCEVFLQAVLMVFLPAVWPSVQNHFVFVLPVVAVLILTAQKVYVCGVCGVRCVECVCVQCGSEFSLCALCGVSVRALKPEHK